MQMDTAFKKDMIKRYPEIANWKPKSVSPPGLTWHHHEDVYRLTLVDRTDHLKNHALYHPQGKDGRELWCGGKEG
ncbi:HNH endonuclease [Taylorella equigenitalis]|uniref:HNH endonuclease n=1 Tax=Taylorella equigenitalis TaxID=29575 RepID=UPI000416CB70